MNIAEKLTTISENVGKVFDAGYAKGKSEGHLEPSGTIRIDENGTHNVYEFAEALVSVPTYEAENEQLTAEIARLTEEVEELNEEVAYKQQRILELQTENDDLWLDVNRLNERVAVLNATIAEKQARITELEELVAELEAQRPSGSVNITENGTYDVTDKAEAVVNVDTVSPYNDGVADGKQAEYDRFWDAFQYSGNRRNYNNGFAGTGWNEETLKPKYKVAPIDTSANSQFGSSMLSRCNGDCALGNQIDFRQIADKFDFSGLKRATYLFDSAGIDYITADLSNAIYIDYAFGGSWRPLLTTLTVKITNVTTSAANAFAYASQLVNLTFTNDSEIATAMNFQWSTKLSKASITSIINALSSTTSGLTVTISKIAKENAFTADEWTVLIATKSNWTISLV